MPVTGNPTTSPSSLTFATLKAYAKDQLQDRADEKAVRRVERIVNRAVRRAAGEKLWQFHLRRERLLLEPRQRYGGVSISADTKTVRLLSGTWQSDAAQWTLTLSGDTELLRIASRDSSTQLTAWSNDVYVSSTDASNVTGYLVHDRYQLPENFRCLAGDLHMKDFFGPNSEISREEMLHLQQTFTPSSGSPINYVLEMNHHTLRYELLMWQWPAEKRSADLYYYFWPKTMTDDADVVDWDPQHDEVLYAAIDLLVVQELRHFKEYPTFRTAYMNAVAVAKSADRRSTAPRVVGGSSRHAKKMQLNKLFTSE